MKPFKKLSVVLKTFLAVVVLALVQTIAFAQDKKVDVNIGTNSSSSNWYTQPWVWIVGGAVFLLLLVALMRGGRDRD